jgi:RNA polymerase sigma-70 factor (ECF subfamily)
MSSGPATLLLLRAWHGGDRQALAELLERNLDWVRDQVKRRLGPALRGQAETLDFVQQAVVDFLEYGPRFEISDDAAFRGLLARIVENNLRDENKRLRRLKRDIGRERGAASDTVLKLDPPVRAVTTPSVLADREERRAWVRLALEFLEPDDRDVILLRDFDDLPFAEVAQRLGINESSARMRHRRALPKLALRVERLRKTGIKGVL